ncbi:hypothetical protein RB201_17835 [Streptomyces sp. S1A(2023)]
MPTATEAIRLYQAEARALTETMGPDARRRALELIDGGGRVRTIAALHRGRTCGFSLGHGDRWTEWTVRPYLAFSVAARHLLPVLPPEGCPCGGGGGLSEPWPGPRPGAGEGRAAGGVSRRCCTGRTAPRSR